MTVIWVQSVSCAGVISPGYNNLTEWPSAANRPVISGTTLNWIGPTGGGPSTTSDVPQSQILTPSGGILTTSAGQIVENLDIAGDVRIIHNNCILRRCRLVDSGFFPINIGSGVTGTLVEDVEMNGDNTGDGNYCVLNNGTNTMLRRLNLHHAENGAILGSDCQMRDCWVHNLLSGAASPHYDGIVCSGGGNLIIDHNSVDMTEHNQTGPVNLSDDFASINNVLINNNLLKGGGYTIYVDAQFAGGDITNVTITNNFLGIGAVGYFNFNQTTPTVSGNVDWITGNPVP